jgi:hypothetical protein
LKLIIAHHAEAFGLIEVSWINSLKDQRPTSQRQLHRHNPPTAMSIAQIIAATTVLTTIANQSHGSAIFLIN